MLRLLRATRRGLRRESVRVALNLRERGRGRVAGHGEEEGRRDELERTDEDGKNDELDFENSAMWL